MPTQIDKPTGTIVTKETYEELPDIEEKNKITSKDVNILNQYTQYNNQEVGKVNVRVDETNKDLGDVKKAYPGKTLTSVVQEHGTRITKLEQEKKPKLESFGSKELSYNSFDGVKVPTGLDITNNFYISLAAENQATGGDNVLHLFNVESSGDDTQAQRFTYVNFSGTFYIYQFTLYVRKSTSFIKFKYKSRINLETGKSEQLDSSNKGRLFIYFYQ